MPLDQMGQEAVDVRGAVTGLAGDDARHRPGIHAELSGQLRGQERSLANGNRPGGPGCSAGCQPTSGLARGGDRCWAAVLASRPGCPLPLLLPLARQEGCGLHVVEHELERAVSGGSRDRSEHSALTPSGPGPKHGNLSRSWLRTSATASRSSCPACRSGGTDRFGRSRYCLLSRLETSDALTSTTSSVTVTLLDAARGWSASQTSDLPPTRRHHRPPAHDGGRCCRRPRLLVTDKTGERAM